MTSHTQTGHRPTPQANDRPLSDYGLIGDMRGAALVASDGSVDWLCLARFDAEPVFLGLLDVGQGGGCTIDLGGPVSTARHRYLDGTNVLETHLTCDTGSISVTDFMPVRALGNVGDVGADSDAPGRLVRILRCTGGTVDVTVRMAPAFDWGRRQTAPVIAAGTASYVEERLFLASSHGVSADGSAVTTGGPLAEGDTLTVVLTQAGPLDVASVQDAPDQLSDTVRYWRDWEARSTYDGPHAGHVSRSALCLKLLTYAPTGAMIAAPTTGLPEAVGGVRNWDYRFVWTRDASFSVSAFLNLGYRREAAEFLRFLHWACHDGEVVRVMYGVDGPVPAEQELDHLAGWRGSSPVLAGNEASGQKQHEIYGELLAALNLYVSMHGTEGLCPSLKSDLPRFVERLAEAAIENWKVPDQGIWELRGDARHLLHTKAMCWVAVDRAIALAPQLGIGVPGHWTTERDAIRDECLERGWNAKADALTMEYGGDALDMSTLRLSLMGMLAADDPRMTSTLRASARDLGEGDLYWRYRFDDGLPGREGAFAACSFWVVAIHTLRGETSSAREMLGRLLSRSTDLGLFSEEFEGSTGEQIGNFPQGFTHMAVIHETVRLHEASAGSGKFD